MDPVSFGFVRFGPCGIRGVRAVYECVGCWELGVGYGGCFVWLSRRWKWGDTTYIKVKIFPVAMRTNMGLESCLRELARGGFFSLVGRWAFGRGKVAAWREGRCLFGYLGCVGFHLVGVW